MTTSVFWSAERDALLLRLRGEGLTFKQIGLRVGRSRSACADRCDELTAEANERYADTPAQTIRANEAYAQACLAEIGGAAEYVARHELRMKPSPATSRTSNPSFADNRSVVGSQFAE